MDPTYIHAPHLDYIAAKLEAVERGEIKRLMLFAPPRHGKSKLTSEIFPAWCLGRNTKSQFMVCCNIQGLAEGFSRNARNTIAMDSYQDIFPATQLSDDSARVQLWTLGGMTRPAMLAVGVGGSPTGQGASCIIIDDPIGTMEEAESRLQRDKTYDWYTSTIRPRLEPGGAIICMMQRWHDDDLAGRLLRDQAGDGEKWDVVDLKAVAEADDPLGRPVGAPLWPARWPLRELNAIRGVNARSWEAKYQQRPRAADGNTFKRPWLRVVDGLPAGLRWFRFWDFAYSIKQTADNTATISGAMAADGTIYLRRGVAGRMESPDAKRLVRQYMLAERDSDHGIEAKMHGTPTVQELIRERELVGISLRAVEVHGDKMVRATPVADRAEAGKVVFVRESPNDDGWIGAWIEEMAAFPYGAHDDRVDAVSGVFSMISKTVVGVFL